MAERAMFVIGNNFHPFSMQEMLVPFSIYKDAYDKEEQNYIDLADKTNPFEYLRDLPEGSKAKEIYEGYANPLQEAGKDFSQNGLSISNRRTFLNLRRRYQGEIGRLVKADTLRNQDIDEQRKISLQDPTRMFSRDASLTTLDNYLDGQRKPYQSYSGALLTQQVATAASALARSLTDFGNGKALDNYTKTWIDNHGFTPTQVAQAINDPSNPNSSKVLTAIVDGAVDSSGIPSWGDVATTNRARQYAAQGLWNAVGQSTVHTYDDFGARLAAQTAASKELEDYKAQLAAAQAQQQNQVSLGEPDSEVLTVFNNAETGALNKYFIKNKEGRFALKSNAGLSQQFGGVSPFIYDKHDKKWRFKTVKEMEDYIYKKYPNPNDSSGASAGQYVVRKKLMDNYNEFRSLLNNAGIGPNSYRFTSQLDKGNTPLQADHTLNNNINKVYLDNTPIGFRDIGLTRLRLNDSGSSAVKNYLIDHATNVREIKDVTSSKGKRTYNTLDPIDVDDLSNEKTTVSSLLYDHTNNQIIATISGKKYTVPIGILPIDEQQNIKRYSQYMSQASTPQQVAKVQSLINNSLMRSLQVYGSHNSTESDYDYKAN